MHTGVQDAANAEPSSITATDPFAIAGTLLNKVSSCKHFNNPSFRNKL